MPMKQYKTAIPQRRTVRIKGRLFDFITCFPIKVEMVGHYFIRYPQNSTPLLSYKINHVEGIQGAPSCQTYP